jgi:hypothetical protein
LRFLGFDVFLHGFERTAFLEMEGRGAVFMMGVDQAALSSRVFVFILLEFGETVGASGHFIVYRRPILLREHAVDILVDKFAILCDRQAHIIVHWRYYKFVAKKRFFLELFQAGMFQSLLDCDPSVGAELEHKGHQFYELRVTSLEVVLKRPLAD